MPVRSELPSTLINGPVEVAGDLHSPVNKFIAALNHSFSVDISTHTHLW